MPEVLSKKHCFYAEVNLSPAGNIKNVKCPATGTEAKNAKTFPVCSAEDRAACALIAGNAENAYAHTYGTSTKSDAYDGGDNGGQNTPTAADIDW